jgi:hypothetical protein
VEQNFFSLTLPSINAFNGGVEQKLGLIEPILNDITKLRKFKGSSSLKPKPIRRIGIKSILRIDTDEHAFAFL